MTDRLEEPDINALGGFVSAVDANEHVFLWAYAEYGDEPATLDADQARQLRDWLTTWLDRQ